MKTHECIGKYYAQNFLFIETVSLPADVFETGRCYYEVVRVISGICIFLEDHLNRLNESVTLGGVSFALPLNRISETIRVLIRKNNLLEGNIRLVLQVRDNEVPVFYACCVPFSYPEPGQYIAGVSTDIYPRERINPNVKQYNPVYQREMNEFRASRKVYEVLLSDESGHITEGSRSNVFLIVKNTLYTAPGDSVLKGITRQKILFLCNNLNYKVIEEAISIETLSIVEAVFLTGTSPKVLPVNAIGARRFSPHHPVMRTLIKAYDRLIAADIERVRRA